MAGIIVSVTLIFGVVVIFLIIQLYLLWFKPNLWVDLQIDKLRWRAQFSPFILRYEKYEDRAWVKHKVEWGLWPARIIGTLYFLIIVVVIGRILWAVIWQQF